MNTVAQLFSLRRVVVVGLSIPIVLFIIIGWSTWQSIGDRRMIRQSLNHTRNVQRLLSLFLSTIKDAETGQRGYLLTLQEDHLRLYREAVKAAPQQLEQLLALTQQRPDQQALLTQLNSLMQIKFSELSETISIVESGDPKRATPIGRRDLGRVTMDKIRDLVRQSEATENQLFQAKQQIAQKQLDYQTTLTLLLISLGLVFLLSIFLLLRRLEQLQSIVKICAWSKTIEHQGKWLSVEQYLESRYNASITHGISDIEMEKFFTQMKTPPSNPKL